MPSRCAVRETTRSCNRSSSASTAEAGRAAGGGGEGISRGADRHRYPPAVRGDREDRPEQRRLR
ncbi:hypothetical protein, partial [Streptomyces sp. SID4917]|uniref:hypothetical protein n=1 Tax=Streptomyces sp. SID4917 TaxID=2690269 RepID=UPI001F3C1D08